MAITPTPGSIDVNVTKTVHLPDGVVGACDVYSMLFLPDRRVLLTDRDNHRIIMLSADFTEVTTVAGNGEPGTRDGAARQAQFYFPNSLTRLPDGRVLVADWSSYRIRVLSADLAQVSTLAGDGVEGYRDGAAAQAQFSCPSGFALLTDGRVLVADRWNQRIRMLSADLQQVSTVAGDGWGGHRDGAAAQAQFNYPDGLALLPDGRVLIADKYNSRIRMLSADLLQVSTVAGDGGYGHRDGAAATAQFRDVTCLKVLDGIRGDVLVEGTDALRVLSPQLHNVTTFQFPQDVRSNIRQSTSIYCVQGHDADNSPFLLVSTGSKIFKLGNFWPKKGGPRKHKRTGKPLHSLQQLKKANIGFSPATSPSPATFLSQMQNLLF